MRFYTADFFFFFFAFHFFGKKVLFFFFFFFLLFTFLEKKFVPPPPHFSAPSYATALTLTYRWVFTQNIYRFSSILPLCMKCETLIVCWKLLLKIIVSEPILTKFSCDPDSVLGPGRNSSDICMKASCWKLLKLSTKCRQSSLCDLHLWPFDGIFLLSSCIYV